ncbi:hypothetical protein P9990_25075 (plasmid) [Prescottella equi]|uniref:hypothetical protein n=1 Tax=Rhodococcus hoagii TaxID=43767 RepID=UPI00257822AA|nr:hypothetical protein [Prescottella equi]WJJ14470.1 hypothetical protein P9990_25075 [Prescottella equi]
MSAETISAVAAAAAAVIACGALYFTGVQARTAKRQTELQRRISEDAAQPYVWADFRLDPRHGQLFQFVVKNEGPTVATDVQLHIDPPLQADWMLGGSEKKQGPHEQGYRFSSLPPGREMVWNLASVFDFKESTDHKKFTVKIEVNGPYGPVEHTYILNIDDYRSGAATAPGTLLGIQRAVEKITTTLDKAHPST